MKCVCVEAPHGAYGLEGFMLGCTYIFINSPRVNNMIRVFPTIMFPEYYESCTKTIFKRFFKKEKPNERVS